MSKNYKKGLIKEKKKKNEKKAKENVLDFYKKNGSYCRGAYLYYKEYEKNQGKYVSVPLRIEKEEFSEYIGEKIVLVITANPIEEAIFLHAFFDKYEKKVSAYLIEEYVYHVICLDLITIVHVHAKKTGEEFTRKCINVATTVFSPEYIILLGICYGIDFDKYELGTVLVAESITGFRVNYRDTDKKDIKFETETEFNEKSNEKIVSRLKIFFNYYQIVNNFFSSKLESVEIKVRFGRLICSNSLMSNKKVKNSIIESLTQGKDKPIGGEMEAIGIFKSNYYEQNNFKNWFVIKSICDWGEDKNVLDEDEKESEIIKDSIQAYAMINSWETFNILIEKNLLIEEEVKINE